jgi:hypothetical protein
VSDASTATSELDAATHRQLGVDLYNSTSTLLEKPDRSALETDEMIHRAHASRWHWGKVGTEVNLARGEWLCSRVYAVLGRAEPALWHARRCVEIDEAARDREDWTWPRHTRRWPGQTSWQATEPQRASGPRRRERRARRSADLDDRVEEDLASLGLD